MKCKNVQKDLSAYLLDELDANQRLEVENHLRTCSSCATEKEKIAKTLITLKSLSNLETSSRRREKVLKSIKEEMVSPQIKQHHGILSLIRKPAFVVIASAALILIILALPLLFGKILIGEDRFTLQVEEVSGKVLVQKGEKLSWEQLQVGALVEGGDWLSTEIDSFIKCKVIASNKSYGTIYLNANTSIRLGRQDKDTVSMLINKGEIYGEFKPLQDRYYVFIDPENDRLSIKEGSFEAGLRYTVSIAPSYTEVPTGHFDIAFTNAKLSTVLEYIKNYTDKTIILYPDIQDKIVSFHSNKGTSDEVFKNFERALEQQGLAIVKASEANTFKILPIVKTDSASISRRLFVKVISGETRLTSSKGEIVVAHKEEGAIDNLGYPFLRKFDTTQVAVWRSESMRQPLLAQGRIPLPYLEVKLVGESKSNPKIEYKVAETGWVANIGDSIYEITIPYINLETHALGDKAEFTIPVKVKIDVKK